MGNILENSWKNVDKKKYRENHTKIFGERERIECSKCGIGSRQKRGEEFDCPHCGEKNEGVR